MAEKNTAIPGKRGLIRRLLGVRPFGVSLGVASIFFISGIIFWGAYNTTMEWSNTLNFCISCHEMKSTVYAEYKKTAHYENRSGVRAICSDCHVPRPWVYKFVRKIKATNELWHWALGSIDTPEKFEAKRLTLAKHVWRDMKQTDSRECRNCHSWDSMTAAKQKKRAWKQHLLARQEGDTCIDCHKGIAHRPVHKLLGDRDDPYDGKPDKRRLPVLAAKSGAKPKPQTAPKPKEAAQMPKGGSTTAKEAGGGDWSAIKGTDIIVFYPGQSSIEWVLKGSDHGGARAIKKLGDRCAECHVKETTEMGAKIVTGKKVEASPIPGKRGSFKVNVKAAHDATNLYLRFQWKDGPHTPAPFIKGGKLDPANRMKLAIMFDDNKVKTAETAGCWATCHNDLRYMPDQPKQPGGAAAKRLKATDWITKYLATTRTAIEIEGGEGKPRGGWDKLKPEAAIAALKARGALMELMRYSSGGGGKTESGYVLDRRVMTGGPKVAFKAELKGGVWTVLLTRPLKAGVPGFIDFVPGKLYTVGFAIHDDYTSARFHHVSLEYRFGLGNPKAEINAVKR